MSAGLYGEIMGPGFAALPAALQQIHRAGAHQARGVCDVVGGGRLARLIGRVMALPAPGAGLDLVVRFDRTAGGEIWRRDFSGRSMVTHLRAGRGKWRGFLIERVGVFSFASRLAGEPEGLGLVLAGWSIGPMPLPGWLMPRVSAREYERDGRFHFDIAIALPLLGPLLAYRGWLEV